MLPPREQAFYDDVIARLDDLAKELIDEKAQRANKAQRYIAFLEVANRLAKEIYSRTLISDELLHDLKLLNKAEICALSSFYFDIADPTDPNRIPKRHVGPVSAAIACGRTGITSRLLELGFIPSLESARLSHLCFGENDLLKYKTYQLASCLNFVMVSAVMTYAGIVTQKFPTPDQRDLDPYFNLFSAIFEMRNYDKDAYSNFTFNCVRYLKDARLVLYPNMREFYGIETPDSCALDKSAALLNSGGMLDFCKFLLERACRKPLEYGLIAGSNEHKEIKAVAQTIPLIKQCMMQVIPVIQKDDTTCSSLESRIGRVMETIP